MKKLTIAALIGAAAMTVLSLVGCTTQYSDRTYPNYTFPFDLALTTTTSTTTTNVVATATAAAYCKYTIVITNLAANIGDKFVVAGASIGSTTSNIGDNWNVTSAAVTDTGLVGTVDSDGTFTISFYGTSPSWGSNNSAEFKICKYDVSSWSAILQTNSDNCHVTNSYNGTGSNYDVVVTIDASKF